MINPSNPKAKRTYNVRWIRLADHMVAAVQQRVESRARRTVDLGCCCLFQPRPGGNLRGPHRTGQRIQGPGPKRSTLAPISLLTHTPLRGTPGRYGSPCWPLC